MSIHTHWKDYKCWCGKTYRSPEKDATGAPLYEECDAHVPTVKRHAPREIDATDYAGEREAAAKA